jgi:hypothetical protein
MKISCNVPKGNLSVCLVDESYTVLCQSHNFTSPYEIDKPVSIPWKDGAIDKCVGKEVYIRFVLAGDAEVFDFSFDDTCAKDDNRAPITPDSDKFVLPPRNDYVMDQKPPFVKSVQNAEPFSINDERLHQITTGYRLSDGKEKGHVLSHKISLPDEEVKISCDASSGSITVSVFDEDGKLLKTSKPITGGLKVRKVVQWPDGFTLDEHIAASIAFKFNITGDAKVYALRFDELFWE